MPKAGTDGQITVTEYLGRFSPDIARMIREVRKVAKQVDPTAEEKAYRGWPMRVMTDQGFIAIAGFREHVNVNFGRGATLKDPETLLEGTGTSIRHVKVRSVADARSTGLRRLIEQELRGGPKRMTMRSGEGRRIFERVRALCLALPGTTERPSHGTPTFFFRDKKQFAQVWSHHHNEGGYAMWCAAPLGAQSALVRRDPERFFVPPYVGHRGWLGVRLDRGIDWKDLGAIIDDAYTTVAS